jgi:6,7-dimethyl-8-ribityllumazine synthase
VTEPGDELRDWPFQDQGSQLRPPRDSEPEPTAQPGETVLFQPPFEVATPSAVPPIEEVSEPDEVALLSVEHAGGDFRVPDGYGVIEGQPSGGGRTVGIVISRFNGDVTNRLLARALAALAEAGVPQESIVVMPVPGAFELPLAAMALAKTRRYSCVVALGCVIRGETSHFDFVAGEAASGLQLAAIETGVPIAFGLLTLETREQADERIERAADSVRTALEMADLFGRLRAAAAAR